MDIFANVYGHNHMWKCTEYNMCGSEEGVCVCGSVLDICVQVY